MIVWLASYPRSGNTLLRTVLKSCLGLDSYSDERFTGEAPLRINFSDIGHVDYEGGWEDFYREATASHATYLVKTHRPPVDDQPFVYVVRDGRCAIRSYKNFHAQFNNLGKSYFSLILGDDAYGDWTSHYRQWMDRPVRRRLLLRFEEIVAIDRKGLAALADVVGHGGETCDWANPFEELRRADGRFFVSGKSGFEPNAHWTPLVERAFRWMHGPLMAELGYAASGLPGQACGAPDPDADELLSLALQILRDNRTLRQVCDERLAVIEQLHAEAEKRLQVINRLSVAGKGE